MDIRTIALALAMVSAGPALLSAQSTAPPAPQTPSAPAAPKAATTPADKTWTDRIRASVNGGGQVTSTSASQTGSFQHFGEPAALHASYRLKSGPLVDGGGVLRVWRNIGVGVSVSHVSDNSTAGVDASIPHPFFPGQPRSTTGSVGVHREETGVHIQAVYRLSLMKTLDVLLGAGPSVINVGQDVVDSVTVTEAFPFETVTFDRASVRRVAKTKTGFNVGADLTWTFSRYLGVGALLRYSHATASLAASSSNAVSIDLGGMHVGGGLRVRF